MNPFTHETNSFLEQQRQQLEKVLRQTPCQEPLSLSRFRKFWQGVIDIAVYWLIPTNEPRIRQRRVGHTTIWTVYDPVHHRTYSFLTEEDVRIWFDQRHYQSFH
jgi:hypothetical protein